VLSTLARSALRIILFAGNVASYDALDREVPRFDVLAGVFALVGSPPMLTFCLCLVFNAHPDFWLPDASIDAKYCQLALPGIALSERALKRVEESLAMDPDNQLQIELAKSLSEQLRELKSYLLMVRLECRVQLLLNKPPRKGR
jgi:hypothetical protein